MTFVFGAKRVLKTGRRLIRVSPYCQNTRILSVFRFGRTAAVSVSAGGCDPQSTHNRPITDPYPAVSTPSRIAYPRIRIRRAVSAVSHSYGVGPKCRMGFFAGRRHHPPRAKLESPEREGKGKGWVPVL